MPLAKAETLEEEAFAAVRSVDVASLTRLLDAGLNVNHVFTSTRDIKVHGMTLMHIAVSENSVPLVRLLVRKGCDVNRANQCRSFDGQKSMVRAIRYHNRLHLTSLFHAICGQNEEIIQALITGGADVNLCDHSGSSALWHGVDTNNARITKAILSAANCNINLPDAFKMAPLHVAAVHKNSVVIQQLLESGALVDPRQLQGATPLYIASRTSSTESIRVLLRHGADPNIFDDEGLSPLHIALDRSGSPELVYLLISAGAFVYTKHVFLLQQEFEILKTDKLLKKCIMTVLDTPCSLKILVALSIKKVLKAKLGGPHVARVSLSTTVFKCTQKENYFVENSHEESGRRIGFTPDEQRKIRQKKPMSPPDAHILKVALIGSPNAGKSTLANKLLGWRFAAVSEKVHTTRKKNLGVFTESNKQIIFLDTPGIIGTSTAKRHQLESSLLIHPHTTFLEADLVIVLVDVSTSWGRQRLDTEILKILYLHNAKRTILVLNKVDLVKSKKKLLQATRLLTASIVDGKQNSFRHMELEPKLDIEALFKKMSERTTTGMKEDASGVTPTEDQLSTETNTDQHFAVEMPVTPTAGTWYKYNKQLTQIEKRLVEENVKGWPHFERVFMVSASEGDGIRELKDFLLDSAHPGQWEFSSDLVTPQSPLELARQCVWEKCMDHLPNEIPYQIQVKIEMFDVDEDGLLRTAFHIICTRKRQYSKVLGKDGETVKSIVREAKQALLDTFRRDLSIKVYVKMKGSGD